MAVWCTVTPPAIAGYRPAAWAKHTWGGASAQGGSGATGSLPTPRYVPGLACKDGLSAPLPSPSQALANGDVVEQYNSDVAAT